MADNKKKYCGVERTLVVFKPDAVQRGIVGEILQRFERVGLKMVGVKMAAPDREASMNRRGSGTAGCTIGDSAG